MQTGTKCWKESSSEDTDNHNPYAQLKMCKKFVNRCYRLNSVGWLNLLCVIQQRSQLIRLYSLGDTDRGKPTHSETPVPMLHGLAWDQSQTFARRLEFTTIHSYQIFVPTDFSVDGAVSFTASSSDVCRIEIGKMIGSLNNAVSTIQQTWAQNAVGRSSVMNGHESGRSVWSRYPLFALAGYGKPR